MQSPQRCMSIGLVLLSTEFHVIGMDEYARQVLGPTVGELGNNLLQYHPRRVHEKIRGLLKELPTTGAQTPVAMVIDVLNKVLMINLRRFDVVRPAPHSYLAMTFIDVSEQTGAAMNRISGLVELKKFPVYDKGGCHFLPADSVYCVESDGNYCRVVTAAGSYYLHLSLKTILQRYAGLPFFRVHKQFIVNLAHVSNVARAPDGRTLIAFDRPGMPSIAVSRRRLGDLRRALALP